MYLLNTTMGSFTNRRQWLYSLKRFIINTVILSSLLFLYLFIPFAWKFIPYINYDFNFEYSVKQGTVIYNDIQLIEYVRNNFLLPPSGIYIDKSQINTTYYSQFVDKLLNKKRNGFFIEASTHSSEQLSNTLFFEKQRNWTGLLIEANPLVFKKLKYRYRNAYLSNSCISTSLYAIELNLTPDDSEKGTIQCFPLMTYLMALNIYHINYFSLVIKDDELQILKQIDFERFKIDVFTIEYPLRNRNTPKNIERIKDFFIGTGLYHQVTTIDNLHAAFKRKSL